MLATLDALRRPFDCVLYFRVDGDRILGLDLQVKHREGKCVGHFLFFGTDVNDNLYAATNSQPTETTLGRLEGLCGAARVDSAGSV